MNIRTFSREIGNSVKKLGNSVRKLGNSVRKLGKSVRKKATNLDLGKWLLKVSKSDRK